jgi:hypothetical protein
MKTYTKLPIPKDSSWGKKTWKYYSPTWLNVFAEGVYNIIRWMPTIYKDKDWDDFYITRLLQVKIEHQREYLVKHNRHERISEDNFWMTVILNLIERENGEYYTMEKYEYVEMHDEILADGYKSEHVQDYINKYPGTYRKVIKLIDVGSPLARVYDIDKHYIAMQMGIQRQEKCRRLLFRILKDKSQQWWD